MEYLKVLFPSLQCVVIWPTMKVDRQSVEYLRRCLPRLVNMVYTVHGDVVCVGRG